MILLQSWLNFMSMPSSFIVSRTLLNCPQIIDQSVFGGFPCIQKMDEKNKNIRQNFTLKLNIPKLSQEQSTCLKEYYYTLLIPNLQCNPICQLHYAMPCNYQIIQMLVQDTSCISLGKGMCIYLKVYLKNIFHLH